MQIFTSFIWAKFCSFITYSQSRLCYDSPKHQAISNLLDSASSVFICFVDYNSFSWFLVKDLPFCEHFLNSLPTISPALWPSNLIVSSLVFWPFVLITLLSQFRYSSDLTFFFFLIRKSLIVWARLNWHHFPIIWWNFFSLFYTQYTTSFSWNQLRTRTDEIK